MTRPRAGTVYRFERYGLDRFDPNPIHPPDGTRVVLTQPHGCPRNGTMGHYFIADAETGEFYGLCVGGSLQRKETS